MPLLKLPADPSLSLAHLRQPPLFPSAATRLLGEYLLSASCMQVVCEAPGTSGGTQAPGVPRM